MTNNTPHYRLMVVGATPSDAQKQVFAPYDRSVIATVDAADGAAVEAALTTAHRDVSGPRFVAFQTTAYRNSI